jgi:hypothetical protein
MKKQYKITYADFARMKKVHNKKKYNDNSFHFYLSFNARIFIALLIIIELGIISYQCFMKGDTFDRSIILEYDKSSEATYDYMFGLDGTLNGINTDFYYNYELEKVVDYDYSRNLNGKLVVYSALDNSVLNEVDYVLVEKVINEEKSNKLEIVQNYLLDHNIYRQVMEDTRAINNVDVYAVLNLNMNVDISYKYEKFNDVTNVSDVVNAKVIFRDNITFENESMKDNNAYIEHKEPDTREKLLAYFGTIFMIIDVVFLLSVINFIVKTLPKKSKYVILRDGLLADYGKVIVNSKKMPKIDGLNVIDCYSFHELLDAQKLLEKPILYYEIVNGSKCVFIILDDNDAYRFVLKKCDVEY